MGVLITPMALAHPLKAGREISAETCGLDDVFPPDDLGSQGTRTEIRYQDPSALP